MWSKRGINNDDDDKQTVFKVTEVRSFNFVPVILCVYYIRPEMIMIIYAALCTGFFYVH
jgi:hypothetical protein